MPVNNPSKNIKVKQAHTFFVKDSQAPAYAEVYNKTDSEKNKPSSFMLTYDKKAIETESKNYHIKLVVKLNTKIPLDLKNPNSYMSTNFDGIKLSIHALLPDLTVASKQFLTYLHDSDTKTNRYLVDISIDPKTTEAILDACADLDARPDGTIDFKMFNMNLLIGLIYKHDVESPVSTDTKPLKKEKEMISDNTYDNVIISGIGGSRCDICSMRLHHGDQCTIKVAPSLDELNAGGLIYAVAFKYQEGIQSSLINDTMSKYNPNVPSNVLLHGIERTDSGIVVRIQTSNTSDNTTVMFNMLGRDVKLVLLGNKSALDIEDAAFPTRPVSETESRLCRAYRNAPEYRLTPEDNATVVANMLRKNISGAFFIDGGSLPFPPVNPNYPNTVSLYPSRVYVDRPDVPRYSSPIDFKQNTKDVLALCVVIPSNVMRYANGELDKLLLSFHIRPNLSYSAEEVIRHIPAISVHTLALAHTYTALEFIFDVNSANLLTSCGYIVGYEILLGGVSIYSSPANAKPLVIESLDRTVYANGYGMSGVRNMLYHRINIMSDAEYTLSRRATLSEHGMANVASTCPSVHIPLQFSHPHGEQTPPLLPFASMPQYNFGMPPMPDFKQPENKPSEAIPSSKKTTTITYDPADIKDKNEAAFYRELAGLFMRYGKELKLVPRSNDKANVSNLRY